MAALSDVISGVVSRFFPTSEADSPLKSHRQDDNLVCAAPSSVYQARGEGSAFQRGSFQGDGSAFHRGSFYQESFYDGNGSVCQEGSVFKDGSVFQDGSVMQGGSVCQSGSFCPAAASKTIPKSSPREHTLFHSEPGIFRPTPLPEVPVIPFKDGTSTLNMRPKLSSQEPPEANLRGGSWLKSDAYKAREAHFFISDPEDLVDVEVAEYFKAHPHAYLKTNFTRVRPGVYSMRGHDVHVEWVESKNKEKKGRLMVRDGSLKLPFAEYMEMKDYQSSNVQEHTYNNSSVFKAKNALHMVPQEQRITFVDPGHEYSRKEAMQMAKEQASFREAAASDWLIKQGQAPPVDRRMMVDNVQLRSPSRPVDNGSYRPVENANMVPPALISTSHMPPPRCGASFSVKMATSPGRRSMPPPMSPRLPHARLR